MGRTVAGGAEFEANRPRIIAVTLGLKFGARRLQVGVVGRVQHLWMCYLVPFRAYFETTPRSVQARLTIATNRVGGP